MTLATFPSTRLRRARMRPWSREMVAEAQLSVSDLIWPVFIQEGKDTQTPIPSLPGVARVTLDILVGQVKKAAALGIPAVALFPAVDGALKTAEGREALNPDNLVCRGIQAIKNAVPDIGVIADVALDPYTCHGHDGLMEGVVVVNDATLEILCEQALIQAKAGCDILAPSDMMDGRVGRIRAALEQEGFCDTLILAYAAKYASAFYAPFRKAVGSAEALRGADKKTYQMDPRNCLEALREIALDVAEGADMLMVKPGLPYLDVISRAAQETRVPILAYQVSGEYAMIRAAAEKGWLDAPAAMAESLIAFKRAGARAVFTYAAMETAERLANGFVKG